MTDFMDIDELMSVNNVKAGTNESSLIRSAWRNARKEFAMQILDEQPSYESIIQILNDELKI